MENFTRVAATGDIPVGSGKSFRVDGKSVAVFNVDGSFHAISDICPHVGGPLGEGMLDGDNVICPWHGWTFNVRTGRFTAHPAAGVDCYPLEVRGGAIYVDVRSACPSEDPGPPSS